MLISLSANAHERRGHCERLSYIIIMTFLAPKLDYGSTWHARSGKESKVVISAIVLTFY